MLATLLYLFINGLFLLKYLPRTTIPVFPVLFAYFAIVLVVLWWYRKSSLPAKSGNLRLWYAGLSTLLIAAVITLQLYIDPLTLQVDRWSAIDHFLVELTQGNYPYRAQTHLGGYGSPFPVWQILHLPFFWMGNIALAMVAVLGLLLMGLIYFGKNTASSLLYLILLLMSPAFWYEAAVRSDLLYLFMLCLLLVLWIRKRQFSVGTHAFGLGLLAGLMLSSRFSVVIPFFLLLFPGFVQAPWRAKLGFAATGLLTFLLTFLPFLLWDASELLFFEYNPFVLQTRQGSWIEYLLLAILLIALSLRWKDNFARYFNYVALTVVVFISITFLHRMASDGFVNGLFSARYDITYFNMALPFVLYGISTNFRDTSV